MTRDLGLTEEEQRLLRAEALPDWTEPMLATLTHEPFSDPDWIYERKLDGVRVLAFIERGQVRLSSRNRQELNETYPEIVDALAAQKPPDLVLDGEVVTFAGRVTSFSRLQGRMQTHDARAARQSGIPVYFYLFDLLHLDGQDLTALPLRQRKVLLKGALQFKDPLRFTRHRNGGGVPFLAEACRKGWEGLIAKRASSSYVHHRSHDWLKLKCGRRQELVIGGFTDPEGTRVGFGALLLGHYDDGNLRYAGRVGTGFDDALLQRLRERLDGLAVERSPFADEVDRESDAHFVRPELVAEIGFTEWTDAGRLRHPRFLGLRADKPARDVVREQAE